MERYDEEPLKADEMEKKAEDKGEYNIGKGECCRSVDPQWVIVDDIHQIIQRTKALKVMK